MGWVGIGRKVERAAVEDALREWFPFTESGELSDVLQTPGKGPPILFELVDVQSEFPIRVDFLNFPGDEEDSIPIFVGLARRFALTFECDTIAEGAGLGLYENYPGYSALFRDGGCFLADNLGTDFGDGEGGPVRIFWPLAIDHVANENLLADAIATIF